MTRSYVFVTWLIDMCGKTRYTHRCNVTRVQQALEQTADRHHYVCDMIHSYTCDMTRSYTCDRPPSYVCVSWGYQDSLLETTREAPTIWYQGVPRWVIFERLCSFQDWAHEPIWAPSQLSVCSHTPTVHSTTISRFPYSFFRMWPLIFCQHTIHQVIWPSPGTLCIMTRSFVRA